jgi:hypothetical protein
MGHSHNWTQIRYSLKSMAHLEIVDAFPDFLSFWADARHLTQEALPHSWAREQMAAWPELVAMQIEDYENQGEDWRAIASKRVFPYLDERLTAMRSAHRNLRAASKPLYTRAQEALGFETDAVFVIHVGIGCGAGWVTTYQDRPAVLFGLENITECGWSEPPALTGLMAHETGHLAHFHWRAQRGKAPGSGPWWQIYEEGFAQRCEHLILGADTWHMAQGAEGDWLSWCRTNRHWLAAEYLRVAEEGGSVRPFFGSWYDIQRQSQTGYYLGHELIRELESSMDLREIALLDDGDPRLLASLRRLAAGCA